MFRYLLWLHAKILGRQLLALGIIRIAVLLLVIGGSMLDPLSSFPMTVLVISVIHISRDDSDFLKDLQFSPRLLYLAEYALISLPGLALILLKRQWYFAGFLPVSILLISMSPSGLRVHKSTSSFSFHLSPTAYEWTSGIRKWGMGMLFIYVITFIVGFFIPELIIAGLLILTSYLCYFYTECEPAVWIKIQNRTPATFLNHKLLQILSYYIPLVLPLIIQFTILKPGWILIGAVSLIVGSSTIFTAMLAKYSLYDEGRNLQLPVAVIAGLGFAGWILPLIPGVLSILLVISLYYRANLKLNRYLYAYSEFYS